MKVADWADEEAERIVARHRQGGALGVGGGILGALLGSRVGAGVGAAGGSVLGALVSKGHSDGALLGMLGGSIPGLLGGAALGGYGGYRFGQYLNEGSRRARIADELRTRGRRDDEER